jgi:hypothetical protein
MKYEIEDNIDFYDLLSNDKANDTNNIIDDRKCLISDEPLHEPFIKLECNHSFNYIPLYLEYMQTKYLNNIKCSSTFVHKTLICPYCRHVTKHLMPYFDIEISSNVSVKKIFGINSDPCSFIDYKYNFMNNFRIIQKDFKQIKKDLKIKLRNKQNVEKQQLKQLKLLQKQQLKEAKLVEKQQLKESKLLQKQQLKEAKLVEKQQLKELKLLQKQQKQSNKQH